MTVVSPRVCLVPRSKRRLSRRMTGHEGSPPRSVPNPAHRHGSGRLLCQAYTGPAGQAIAALAMARIKPGIPQAIAVVATTRTRQLCQRHRIATVRLHPVARLHRDQRGCHDDAIVAHLSELPVQAIAARPCGKARTQPTAFNSQLRHPLADVIRTVRDCPPRRTPPPPSPCATASEIVALWTSGPMNVLSCMWSLPQS